MLGCILVEPCAREVGLQLELVKLDAACVAQADEVIKAPHV